MEYLRGIKGTYGNYGGKLVVKSLSFITNGKNIYGPFGKEAGGTPFSFVMKEGGAIVGFHGRCGSYLDAVGVYLQKLRTKPKEADQTKVEPNEPMVEEIEIHDVHILLLALFFSIIMSSFHVELDDNVDLSASRV